MLSLFTFLGGIDAVAPQVESTSAAGAAGAAEGGGGEEDGAAASPAGGCCMDFCKVRISVVYPGVES